MLSVSWSMRINQLADLAFDRKLGLLINTQRGNFDERPIEVCTSPSVHSLRPDNDGARPVEAQAGSRPR